VKYNFRAHFFAFFVIAGVCVLVERQVAKLRSIDEVSFKEMSFANTLTKNFVIIFIPSGGGGGGFAPVKKSFMLERVCIIS
jgi:hypothetical protein